MTESMFRRLVMYCLELRLKHPHENISLGIRDWELFVSVPNHFLWDPASFVHGYSIYGVAIKFRRK